jgi:hypothetical protein
MWSMERMPTLTQSLGVDRRESTAMPIYSRETVLEIVLSTGQRYPRRDNNTYRMDTLRTSWLIIRIWLNLCISVNAI